METANEIVRYLNLELQNYKNAYDIFGPQENKQISLVGQGVSKPSQHSHSISDSQMHTESIKSKKERYENEIIQEELKSSTKDALSFRKWNDVPAIKQLKLFDDKSEASELL